jgi:ADP-heptose:LPS heptosyltransferase
MIEYIKLLFFLIHPRTVFIKKRSGAIGDDLLMSCVLPGIKKKFPGKKIIVEARWKSLFKNNPYIHWVTDKHIKTTKKHLKPKYVINENSTIPIITQICHSVNLKLGRPPQIYLNEEEIRLIEEKFRFPYIVISPEGKQKFSKNRKDWGINNFQLVRDAFSQIQFIQTGANSDKLLQNVIDERGLDIRLTAALLKKALFYIGLEGGLMHLSKAVGQKSVIIYGGALKWQVTGYEENLNITSSPECSPCFHSQYKHEECSTMICMKSINPFDVIEKIKRFQKKLNKGNT